MKAYTDPLNDGIVESLNVVFRTNHVIGAVLFRFTDEEWKELVPYVCLRVHIRDALAKIIQADEKTAVSQLHRNGLSNKPITELTPKATTLRSSRSRRTSRSTAALREAAPRNLPAPHPTPTPSMHSLSADPSVPCSPFGAEKAVKNKCRVLQRVRAERERSVSGA